VSAVDLDAFAIVHGPEWDRLAELSRRRRPTGEEIDELVTLYQRAATHLSVLRSASADPAFVARLSTILAQARTTLTGSREPFLGEAARLVTVSFPAAVHRCRRWALASAAFTILVSFAVGRWVAGDPRAQASVATPPQIRQLVDHDFEGYYSEYAAGSFAAQVWSNNAWVATVCIAFGFFGLPVVWVLFQNALNLGTVGGLMAANGKLDLFFGMVTPHGLLELTAVFVAAGAGLQLFWAWVVPGPVPRSQALAREGRSMITVALGLVAVLAVSGIVEAFVTPSPLDTWARIAVGTLVWASFLVYVGVLGGRAVRSGQTGDLRDELLEDVVPVAG
jgi:uncharacterized membrane protein SpoIIM required for sporulation